MKLSELQQDQCGIIAGNVAVLHTPNGYIFVQNGKIECSNKILFDIEVSSVLPISSGELYIVQKNNEIHFIGPEIESIFNLMKSGGTIVITKI